MISIGKYNMSRFAATATGSDANDRWLAAATGGRRFATVRFWSASDNGGAGAPYTGYEAIYLTSVDGHPCWVLISDSESHAMVEGERELRSLAAEMISCRDCRGGTHREPKELTAYPDRDEHRHGFVARVRALVEG